MIVADLLALGLLRTLLSDGPQEPESCIVALRAVTRTLWKPVISTWCVPDTELASKTL